MSGFLSERDVAKLCDEAIIDSLGAQILNASDPLIALVDILSSKYEFSAPLLFHILLAPSACPDLDSKDGILH